MVNNEDGDSEVDDILDDAGDDQNLSFVLKSLWLQEVEDYIQ